MSHGIALEGPARFARLLDHLDEGMVAGAAANIVLRLICDAAVLHVGDLRAATSAEAEHYLDGRRFMLEWPRDGGFMDRRVLSPMLANAIAKHGGPELSVMEWGVALREVRGIYGNADSQTVWRVLISDARAWWLDHLTPVLLGHACREQAFQPLPRSALARRAQLRARL